MCVNLRRGRKIIRLIKWEKHDSRELQFCKMNSRVEVSPQIMCFGQNWHFCGYTIFADNQFRKVYRRNHLFYLNSAHKWNRSAHCFIANVITSIRAVVERAARYSLSFFKWPSKLRLDSMKPGFSATNKQVLPDSCWLCLNTLHCLNSWLQL